MNGDPSPPHQPHASPPPACTVVAAVLQNRAREVGVALFDKRGGPSLDLEQHVEVGESHATTLCELQRARPGVILTLAGDRGGTLGDALARFARAHDCALIELPRKQFGARGPAHSCVFSRLTAPPFLLSLRRHSGRGSRRAVRAPRLEARTEPQGCVPRLRRRIRGAPVRRTRRRQQTHPRHGRLSPQPPLRALPPARVHARITGHRRRHVQPERALHQPRPGHRASARDRDAARPERRTRA